ncbi:hypothetical protein IQ16_03597 [Bradyrhizobium huanghuaihaiense]|uniref:Uncharacterized protein n=1 Tax=Bradyrhizobium huanghuaihaiense TaxID=990078 RepID=A0A562RPE5_9BRAD|nr:hypothetical protein [Bradyrhizobium huanghuaihaiense]TWI70424.1 hypothetical protein IQ16_03597 [Bradyrhizobium huanghuaihaiense]
MARAEDGSADYEHIHSVGFVCSEWEAKPPSVSYGTCLGDDGDARSAERFRHRALDLSERASHHAAPLDDDNQLTVHDF